MVLTYRLKECPNKVNNMPMLLSTMLSFLEAVFSTNTFDFSYPNGTESSMKAEEATRKLLKLLTECDEEGVNFYDLERRIMFGMKLTDEQNTFLRSFGVNRTDCLVLLVSVYEKEEDTGVVVANRVVRGCLSLPAIVSLESRGFLKDGCVVATVEDEDLGKIGDDALPKTLLKLHDTEVLVQNLDGTMTIIIHAWTLYWFLTQQL